MVVPMAIYKGDQKIKTIHTGMGVVNSVYKGNQLVYLHGFDPITFTDSGSWVVPTGIKQIRVDCVAAKGMDGTAVAVGGKGGRVQCVLNVTSGQTLYVTVGKIPTNNGTAVYNASDIRIGGQEYADRVIVAGGGGSGGTGNNPPNGSGGNGGDLTGGRGEVGPAWGSNGTGGTQTAGGAAGGVQGAYFSQGAAGKLGLGGNGGSYGGGFIGGAGGAGYYGGGGGSSSAYYVYTGTGGGGGSSYTHPDLCSEVVHTQGYQDDNGYVTLSMV